VFHIHKQLAKVAHINLREEKHGDESVTAMDIKIAMDVPNDYLNDLAPGLLGALYAPHEKQGSLDGRMVTLRWPLLGAIPWQAEQDMSITFFSDDPERSFGVEGAVNKTSIVCKDGGTVTITFRFQILPDDELVAAFAAMLGQSVKISIGEATMTTSEDPKWPKDLLSGAEDDEGDYVIAKE
jgi:hypothetical protein